MTNKDQAQQGDVLLRKVNVSTKGFKKVSQNGLATLAKGEQTGHHHSVYDDNTAILEAPDGKLYTQNENDFDVETKHQEHHPVKISPGIHEIGIVREHDYFKDMVGPVQD